MFWNHACRINNMYRKKIFMHFKFRTSISKRDLITTPEIKYLDSSEWMETPVHVMRGSKSTYEEIDFSRSQTRKVNLKSGLSS